MSNWEWGGELKLKYWLLGYCKRGIEIEWGYDWNWNGDMIEMDIVEESLLKRYWEFSLIGKLSKRRNEYELLDMAKLEDLRFWSYLRLRGSVRAYQYKRQDTWIECSRDNEVFCTRVPADVCINNLSIYLIYYLLV